MFGTKGIKDNGSNRGTSPYLGYGINLVKFNKFSVVESSQKTSKRIQCQVESMPVEEEGFKPDAEATDGGQIGRVNFTIWLNPSKPYYEGAIKELNESVATLATKILGQTADEEAGTEATPARAKFDKDTNVESLEEFVEAMNDHLTGEYVWFAMTGEEYGKSDGSIGVIMNRRRWGFVASQEEGEDHLKPFDKSNPNDYKVYIAPSPEPKLDSVEGTNTASNDTDDLPF